MPAAKGPADDTSDTLQEHQNILQNATISRDSDIEYVLGQWEKKYFKASNLVQ